MLDHELVRFPSCAVDAAALIISCGAIFHLELSPMPEFSLHSEGSSVSSPFFRSPDDISQVKNLLEGISYLSYDGDRSGFRR